MHLLAVLTILAGLCICAAGVALILETRRDARRPAPWTIVYDGQYAYSYIGAYGQIADENFATFEAAQAAATASKTWHENYQRSLRDGTDDKLKAEKLARAARFRPVAP